MAGVFLLIPSPLLGPATWRPVEEWLRGQGHRVQVVDFGSAPRTPAAVLDAVTAAAGDQAVVLVPHSNAGLYAPHLTSLMDVEATVFVDAALPGLDLEDGETQLATPAFLDFLRDLADERGVLPPWTDWWGDAISDLFPDAAVRQAVEREQQRLPLTYFTSRLLVPSEWTALPASYLAFGDTYAEELQRAAHLGWATRTLAGDHLHALHDPAAVGATILDLTHRAVRLRGLAADQDLTPPMPSTERRRRPRIAGVVPSRGVPGSAPG